MATATKASTSLPKEIFAVEVKNHELLKQAYLAYLANSRPNLAKTLTRGDVRGGGKKPWKQKGTGRARFGSSRNPIWRGGGITFGPTGNENYTITMPTSAKRTALRQALTLAAKSNKLQIIDTFECKDGKVSSALDLLKKTNAEGNVLLVVSLKDDLVERATRNLKNLNVLSAKYITVYDILNADTILMSQKSLEAIQVWLMPSRSLRRTSGGTK